MTSAPRRGNGSAHLPGWESRLLVPDSDRQWALSEFEHMALNGQLQEKGYKEKLIPI
jgi:hypothetical protein